eukprot:scaffold55084_cov21-Prasinocladus_malaysianus.AAC.1
MNWFAQTLPAFDLLWNTYLSAALFVSSTATLVLVREDQHDLSMQGVGQLSKGIHGEDRPSGGFGRGRPSYGGGSGLPRQGAREADRPASRISTSGVVLHTTSWHSKYNI